MKTLRTGTCTSLFVILMALGLHAAPTLNCGASLGTKFNLEPSSNAVPQQLESVDFIPNRIALNQDLVVAGAYDSRGVPFAPVTAVSSHWDGSVSGYYVHRTPTTGCVAVRRRLAGSRVKGK